jgi:fructokinase
MADILCFGDLLIDFVPTTNTADFADLPTFKPAPGGAAANVAVGLARLGVPSALMAKVGDEAFGHALVDIIGREGVDVRAIRFETRARTALAFVMLRPDGERDFLFYRHPSADMLFTPDDVDRAAIRAAKIFHFDSISLAAEQPRATALFAADEAIKAGALISYDVNLRLPLWESEAAARLGVAEGLKRASVVKVSEDELAFMAGEASTESVRSKLWHDGMKLVVLSLGERGCVAIKKESEIVVPGIPVTPVDTTGAGDGFVAGLLSRIGGDPGVLEDDATLAAACRFANAVGAFTTMGRGAIPSLPTVSQVEALLQGI